MQKGFQLESIESNKIYRDEKYSGKFCRDVLNATFELYKLKGFHYPWIGYLANDSNIIVGAAGFNGRPQNNIVEISYYTFEEYQGKGFASNACKELIKISKQQNPHITICAKTAPEENASTRILRKNGFVYKDIVQDHDIGDAWLWELLEY